MKISKFFLVMAALAALLTPHTAGAVSPGSFEASLLDGHLTGWEARWKAAPDAEVRLWGREAGAVTGSLAAGPVLVGALGSSAGGSLSWSFAPSRSASPGTWAALWGRGKPLSAWFLQTPDAVGVGAQMAFEGVLGSVGAGWQRSWPTVLDEGRWQGAIQLGGLSGSYRGAVVAAPGDTRWGADAQLEWKARSTGTALRWKQPPGEPGTADLRLRWGALSLNAQWPAFQTQPGSGGAAVTFSRARGHAKVEARYQDGWIHEIQAGSSVARVKWQLGGTLAPDASAWSLSPEVSWAAPQGDRWTARATWKGSATSTGGGELTGEWKGTGQWSALLHLKAPTGEASWFGRENETAYHCPL